MRIHLALAAALVVLAVGASSSSAGPFAEFSVQFSADYSTATITSTKGVSHYDIVLCDGTTTRYELSGQDKVVTAGPFDAQIVSLTAKAGRSSETFFSGFQGECKKPDPPKEPEK